MPQAKAGDRAVRGQRTVAALYEDDQRICYLNGVGSPGNDIVIKEEEF